MKRTLTSVAVIAVIFVSFSVQAQFARIEDAIKYHQSSPSLMCTHLRRIETVVTAAKVYDKAALEADVTILEMLLRQDVVAVAVLPIRRLTALCALAITQHPAPRIFFIWPHPSPNRGSIMNLRTLQRVP